MHALLLTALLLAPADAAHVRHNEAPVDLDAAWEEMGFRMQLGLGFELTRSPFTRDDAWNAVSVHVEPGARLSPRWSVALPIEYAIATGPAYDGLRWTALAQLAWHPSTGSYVALAAGYGGMLMSGEDTYGDSLLTPAPGAEEDTEPPGKLSQLGVHILRDCTGDGLVARLGVGHLWRSGELFATGPMLSAQTHWTHCAQEDDGDLESTRFGEARWLTQLSATASWMFAWR